MDNQQSPENKPKRKLSTKNIIIVTTFVVVCILCSVIIYIILTSDEPTTTVGQSTSVVVVPTDTPVLPTDTQAPTYTPEPTNTPEPTKTPAPTNRIGQAEVFCPTDNEQARQFYNDAISMQEEGKFSEAKQLFLKAIEFDPEFCDAMDNLGLILRSQGKVEEAIAWYTKSIEIYPNNIVAHQNLAVAFRAQGEFDSAIAEGQLLIDIDPDNPEGYYGLGMSYLNMNQPQEALTHLKKAEELYIRNSSPLVTDARFLIGVAHYMLENCEQAIDYFESVYSAMRDNPGINYTLGLCYLTPQLENLKLAKKYLSRAQELGKQIPADLLQIIEE